jgi:hypothetical protein
MQHGVLVAECGLDRRGAGDFGDRGTAVSHVHEKVAPGLDDPLPALRRLLLTPA